MLLMGKLGASSSGNTSIKSVCLSCCSWNALGFLCSDISVVVVYISDVSCLLMFCVKNSMFVINGFMFYGSMTYN